MRVAQDFRTLGDQVGDQRRELAERLGCPHPDQLGFFIEGEPGYQTCAGGAGGYPPCGACDECMLAQARFWHEQTEAKP